CHAASDGLMVRVWSDVENTSRTVKHSSDSVNRRRKTMDDLPRHPAADIGAVEDRFFTLRNFPLTDGTVMPEATIAYETYGGPRHRLVPESVARPSRNPPSGRGRRSLLWRLPSVSMGGRLPRFHRLDRARQHRAVGLGQYRQAIGRIAGAARQRSRMAWRPLL